MTRSAAALFALVVLAVAPTARAGGPTQPSQPAPPAPPPARPADPAAVEAHITAAHAAYVRGDYLHARDELLAAYALDPRPALLFALGQAEFNLGHYHAAIDYYERFTATDPAPDQVALAQQAIGAARIKLETPPPPPPHHDKPLPPLPPPPPPHREFDRLDRTMTLIGGIAALGGGGLIVTSVVMSRDSSGTLHSYDRRVHDAVIVRDVGIASLAGGALVVGAALLRWRFHLVDTTIGVEASPSRVGLSLEHPL